MRRLKKANVYSSLLKSAEKVKRKIRVWYFDEKGEFRSDIDYIDEFLRFYKDRSRAYKHKVLLNIEKTVERLKKLPHEWTLEDLINLRNELYEEYKENLRKKVEEKGDDPHSRFYALSERDIDIIARNNVFAWLVSIRTILRYLGREEIISKLETRKWKVIHSKIQRRKEYLDFEEVLKVLRSNELSHNEKIWFMLELTTGARHDWRNRESELLGLRLIDFYEDDGVLRCDIYSAKTQVVWRGIRLDLFDRLFQKAGYSLVVEIKRLLRTHRNKNQKVYEVLGFKVRDLQVRLPKKISKIVGRRITGHFMRHSHATLLVRLGVPMELIAGHREYSEFGVGWSDLNTLYSFYVALGKWKYKEAYKSIEEQLSKL